MVRSYLVLNVTFLTLINSALALVDAIATDLNAEDFDLSFTGIGVLCRVQFSLFTFIAPQFVMPRTQGTTRL